MSSISNLSKRKLDSSTSTSTSERERNPKHRKSNSSTPTSKTCLLPDVPLFSDKSARALSALTSKQALKSKDNPITNSRLGQNTQHYTSSSTGHQQANKVGVSAENIYLQARYSKLQKQAAKKETDLFKGIIAHITGYTGNHRNTVLTRLLQENGAQILPVPSSRATHTISASPLSAKKTHENMKRGKVTGRKYLVKPEWITESLEKGRKLWEGDFQPKAGAAGFEDGVKGKVFEGVENPIPEIRPEYREIKGKKTQRSLLEMMTKK